MSPSSASSQLSSPPSSPTQVDNLLGNIVGLKSRIAELQAQYDALIQQLDAHVRDGLIPIDPDDGLTFNGWRFTQATRRTYTLPKSHPITLKEKALKAEKELAIVLGEATEKVTSYWSLRSPKPEA